MIVLNILIFEDLNIAAQCSCRLSYTITALSISTVFFFNFILWLIKRPIEGCLLTDKNSVDVSQFSSGEFYSNWIACFNNYYFYI
jgi:hypothetical protein